MLPTVRDPRREYLDLIRTTFTLRLNGSKADYCADEVRYKEQLRFKTNRYTDPRKSELKDQMKCIPG